MTPTGNTLVEAARTKWLADDHDEALTLFRQGLAATPQDLRLAVEVASYLGLRFEIEEARQLLNRCEQQLQNNTQGLYQVGLAYERSFQSQQAFHCFERVLREQPGHAPARVRIAEWYERRGLLEDAERTLDESPADFAEVGLVRAQLRRRQGQVVDAQNLLEQLTARDDLSREMRIRVGYALADVYDRRERFADAFAMATSAKQLQQQEAAPHLQRAQQLAKLEANFVTTVNSSHYQRWAASTSRGEVALLSGSPRSGTTLLARALGNHAGIHLADEINAYATYAHREMLKGQTGKHAGDVLDSIPRERLARCRTRYLRWINAAAGRENEGQGLLLDKNPSTTFLIPAFRRLFPRAPLVMALRDPRDVIISCYLQGFPMNPVSAMFTRLDLAVIRCRAELEGWLRLRQQLTPPWSEIRYEELVQGDDSVLGPALQALGVGWQDGLLSFQDSLRSDPVRSPSYAQLFEPLHRNRIGRWHAYREQLQPFLPQLEPVCRVLGYE